MHTSISSLKRAGAGLYSGSSTSLLKYQQMPKLFVLDLTALFSREQRKPVLRTFWGCYKDPIKSVLKSEGLKLYLIMYLIKKNSWRNQIALTYT